MLRIFTVHHREVLHSYPEYPEQYEGYELYEVPRVVILHVEHDKVIVSERVERAQHKRGGQSTEERAPQCLEREVVAHLRTKVNVRVRIMNNKGKLELGAIFVIYMPSIPIEI